MGAARAHIGPGVTFGAALLAAALVAPLDLRPGHVPTEDSVVVSDSPQSPSSEAQIAVTGDGTVHVVWAEGTPDASVILHRRRAPDGTWSAPVEVFWGATQPSMATDGSTVAAAFVRTPFDHTDSTEILFSLWRPATGQWQEEATAIEGDIGLAGSQPAVAFDRFSGQLWIVWANSRRAENVPYYARIQVASGQVESADVIERYEEGAQGPVVVVDAENDVYAAWSANYPSGEAEVVLWEWSAGATFWSPRDTAGYDRLRQARAPAIAEDGGVVCLAWHEGDLGEPNEVVLSCEKASGNVWLGNISRSTGVRSLVPSIALEARRGAMVAWRERTSPPPEQLLFAQGLPPAAAAAVVTDGSAATVDGPALAYHAGYVYAVWTEATGAGGSDVRFARWQVDVPTPTPAPSDTPSPTPTATRTLASPTRTEPPPVTRTPSSGRGRIFLPFAEAR